jgi:hypothetical protein
MKTSFLRSSWFDKFRRDVTIAGRLLASRIEPVSPKEWTMGGYGPERGVGIDPSAAGPSPVFYRKPVGQASPPRNARAGPDRTRTTLHGLGAHVAILRLVAGRRKRSGRGIETPLNSNIIHLKVVAHESIKNCTESTGPESPRNPPAHHHDGRGMEHPRFRGLLRTPRQFSGHCQG